MRVARLDRREHRRGESCTSKSAKTLTRHRQTSISCGKDSSVGGTHLDERKDGPAAAGPSRKTTGRLFGAASSCGGIPEHATHRAEIQHGPLGGDTSLHDTALARAGVDHSAIADINADVRDARAASTAEQQQVAWAHGRGIDIHSLAFLRDARRVVRQLYANGFEDVCHQAAAIESAIRGGGGEPIASSHLFARPLDNGRGRGGSSLGKRPIRIRAAGEQVSERTGAILRRRRKGGGADECENEEKASREGHEDRPNLPRRAEVRNLSDLAVGRAATSTPPTLSRDRQRLTRRSR